MKKLICGWWFGIALLTWSCDREEANLNSEQVNQWIHFTDLDGLAGNSIQAIYEDLEGNIWFGHESNGLSVYDGSNFQAFDETDGLIDNTVYAITQDSTTGDLWFGTAGGLGFLAADGSWAGISEISGFPFEVYALHTDASNAIWVGTNSLGYWTVTAESFDVFIDQVCLLCNQVNVFEESADGTIWAGTGGGLKHIENSSETLYTVSDGLPDNDVRSVFQDHWGHIWAGTFFGKDVVYFDGSGFETVSLYNGVSVNAIFSINQESSGWVWIGSAVGGLMYYDGSIVRTVDNAVDPGNIAVLSMLVDSNKNLWVGTDDDGVWLRITP